MMRTHDARVWLPRCRRARAQLAAAGALLVTSFTGTAAVQVQDATASSRPLTEVSVPEATVAAAAMGVAPATGAVEEVAAPRPDGTFTIGDLAAGRVPQEEQDRFWQGQLDAILAAPCTPATAGGTTVTLFLGADEVWTERLTAAVAERAEACGA